MKTEPQQINIAEVELRGSVDLLRVSPLSLSFPDSNLCLVLGENGSGKSLIATVISTILSSKEVATQFGELRSAGLQQIRLEFRVQSGRVAFHGNLETGDYHWETLDDREPDYESNGSPSDPEVFLPLYRPALFRQLHFIVNGYQAPPLRDEIAEIGTLLRKPLDVERDAWREKLTALSGAGGQGGQLRKALDTYEKSKRDQNRIRELHAQIEANKEQQRDLNLRLTGQIKFGAILMVEREEIERKTGLAERAARIDTWLSEVRNDEEKVEALREEHTSSQEELDRLSSRFRAAPEQFEELLADYSSMTEDAKKYRQSWEALEQGRTEASEKIRETEQQLETLPSADPEDTRAGLDELKHKVQADESALMGLLRDRISLVRQRDGIEQRFRSEFRDLHEAGSAARNLLKRYCEKAGDTQLDAQASEPRKVQDEIDTISAQLKESYAGFDSLTESAEEELQDLFKTRKVISNTSDILESLQARKIELEASGRGPRWILAAIAAGFVVGTPVGTLGGWDIGFFAALISSGLIWLAYRNSRKGIETKQTELSGHERKLRVRWSTSVEARQLLEMHLCPFAHAQSLPEAQTRLASFRKLTSDLAHLKAKLSHAASLPDPELLELHATLPEKFKQTPPARLTSQLRDYQALSAEFARLETAWDPYEGGGEIANRIEQLESQVSRQKRESEETEQALLTSSQQYSSGKQSLTERLSSLRNSLPTAAQVEHAADRLRSADETLKVLAEDSGQILKDRDAAAIKTEWHRLQDLRVRQRVLKNELSARLALDEIRSRQSILSDELHDVAEQLTDLDPLYMTQGNTTAYAEKYRSQLGETSRQISDNHTEAETLRRELDLVETDTLQAELSKSPSLDSLEAEVKEHEQSVAKVQREIHTTEELIESLDRELMELDDGLVNHLQNSVNRILHLHFNGNLGVVKFVENEWLLVSSSGQSKRLSTLSRGQSDLLRLVIQAGILHALRDVETGFVLWDDVLGGLDDRYLAGMKELLSDLAETRQVILMTRDGRFREWGKSVQLGSIQSVHS